MWLLLKKELTELARDRRALIKAIVIPALLMPVLGVLIGGVLATVTLVKAQQPLRFAIVAAEVPYPLAGAFSQQAGFVRQPVASGEQARAEVQAGKLDFALLLPERNIFNQRELATNHWQLLLNSSGLGPVVEARVRAAIQPLVDGWQDQQLQALGLATDMRQALITPVELSSENLAGEQAVVGSAVGAALAYLLLMAAMVGAAYPAIDLICGERERQTLETLLATPLPLPTIALVKTLVVTLTAMVAVVATLLPLLLMVVVIVPWLPESLADSAAALPGGRSLLLALLLLLPYAAVMGALLIAASAFARSYKEAQTMLGPVLMLAFVPALIALIPELPEQGWLSWLPALNVGVGIVATMKQTIGPALVIKVLVTNLGLVALVLRFCVRRLGSERLLLS